MTHRADWRHSLRGYGHEFGKGFSHPWMRKNGIDLVVRSHQCKTTSGLAQNHEDRVLTVFSSSNYYWKLWGVGTSAFVNDGSVLIFDAPGEGVKPNVPRHYTWSPILLPVDDPHNSAVLYLTGKGFQHSVRDGQLNPGHDDQERGEELTMNGMLQQQGEFNALMREKDPQGTGLCDPWYGGYFTSQGKKECFASDEQVKYKELIAHYRKHLRGPSSDWHSEIVAAYVAHMQAQGAVLTEQDVLSGKETMSRATLRQVVPVQFLSDDQVDSFLERRRRQKTPPRKPIKIVWAVDRRAERIARIRERLQENLVGEEKLKEALVSAEKKEGILSQRGVMDALNSLGAGSTQCCGRDLAEEMGERWSSLEEPGLLGSWIRSWWDPSADLSTSQVQDVLMPAQRGAEASSEHQVVKALGLGQPFLMAVYRHRHKLTSTSPCGRTGITVQTMKEALKQMNKANNFPLSHPQLDMIGIATMGDDGMIAPERLHHVLTKAPRDIGKIPAMRKKSEVWKDAVPEKDDPPEKRRGPHKRKSKKMGTKK